ncbi:hypothetical protein V565_020410 [Rhizoctonia solani 123E]|uniref:Uncharacterized protein n=1 Tax=Rhizoctonia solani 123E TaxID=1423351 RepID=A0A074S9J9_9AGAM|nr:hypothetical protein V565_020410 [Rhizoctonia solani 123E]
MPKDTNKENVSPNLRRARQKAAAWPYRVPTLGGHHDPRRTTRMGPPVQTTSNAPRTKTLPNRQAVPKSNIPIRCRGKCCATKFHPNLGLDSHFSLGLSPNSHFSIIPKFNSNLKFKATRK